MKFVRKQVSGATDRFAGYGNLGTNKSTLNGEWLKTNYITTDFTWESTHTHSMNFVKAKTVGFCNDCHKSCLTCTGPKPEHCLTCLPGTHVSVNTGIAKNPIYCKKVCIVGQYWTPISNQAFEEGDCIPCHPACSACSGPGILGCTLCSSSYYMNEEGECKVECKSGFYRDFNPLATNEIGVCSKCDINCTECGGPYNGQCSSCIDGYEISQITSHSFLQQIHEGLNVPENIYIDVANLGMYG